MKVVSNAVHGGLVHSRSASEDSGRGASSRMRAQDAWQLLALLHAHAQDIICATKLSSFFMPLVHCRPHNQGDSQTCYEHPLMEVTCPSQGCIGPQLEK